MVYSWKIKKLAQQIDQHVDQELKTWSDIKCAIKVLRPDLNNKLTNWCAHLCVKQRSRRKSSLFDYYLKKVLENKAMLKRLFESLE